MNSSKTFKLATLGCRTNQYESEAYAKQLKELGYREVGEHEAAELCIVNTCTVTEEADRSSRHSIRTLAKKHPGSKIVVTGCLAEAMMKDPMPEIALLVPNARKEDLMQELFPNVEELPEFSINQFEGHTRAFVKVQDGCNSFCTYCIIPYVRGRSRSRRVDDILEEVRRLIASGYKEVVLTGINIGDFDGAPEPHESPVRLADLVRAVDQIEGLKRLRISSIDPDEVDDDLQDAILSGKHTCHSMHLVLQSGSNVVLKRMNRKYTRQIFIQTAQRLKKACPDFTFTTDVIVGFPGETDQDFEETLSIMREVQFAKVHMFPYSPRNRTRAALFPHQIPSEIMQIRKQEVLRLSEQSAFSLRQKFIGKKMSVLIEDLKSHLPGYVAGHTENFLKVFVPKEGLRPHDIVDVLCEDNLAEGLKGVTCT